MLDSARVRQGRVGSDMIVPDRAGQSKIRSDRGGQDLEEPSMIKRIGQGQEGRR